MLITKHLKSAWVANYTSNVLQALARLMQNGLILKNHRAISQNTSEASISQKKIHYFRPYGT